MTRTLSNDAYASTTLTDLSQSYGVNGPNQYTSVGGSTHGYDPNGNLSSDGTTSFGYDAENRLVVTSCAKTATLVYDPLGYNDQMNLYAYASNDPLNIVDPYGLYGRGKGWEDKEWEHFDAGLQAAANDMDATATNLEGQAGDLENSGDSAGAAGLREEAGSLRAGAAVLRSTDLKAHAVRDSASARAAGIDPGDAAGVDPGTLNVTVDLRQAPFSGMQNEAWTAGQSFKFAIGHESLHSSGIQDHARLSVVDPSTGRVALNAEAYRYGKPSEQAAYRSISLGSSMARGNPDHLMSRVYP